MSILDGIPSPNGWQTVPFGRVFVRRTEAEAPHLEPLSVFLDAGVIPRSARSDNHNELGADLSKYLVVREGDLVFNKLRTWQGGFGASSHHGIVSPAYFVCTPVRGVNSRFVDYQLHSKPYLAELTRLSKWQPPSQFDTPWDQLRAVPLRLPSEAEQTRIVDALDSELARLAELRAAGRRLRELRTEHQAALLAETMLEPRYSSVQIRHVARTGTGHTPSRSKPEYWAPEECVIPWFTLADVWQIRDDRAEVVSATAEKISVRGVANSSAVVHPAGTVLLSRTASVGFSAVMEVDMAVSQDFMTWTCGPELDPFFLLYALRAMRPELHRLMMGSTHKTIYMPDLHALRCPLPPISEQRALVEHARGQSEQNWALDDRIARLDDRLSEYATVLITEAVTTGRLPNAAGSAERAPEALQGSRR